MSYYANLSGIPVIAASLVVPFAGIWHADVVLAQETDVAGAQVLSLAGSTWNCAYVRAIDFAGRRGVRLVGGNGGWRTAVPAKQYLSASGVVLSMVMGDLASLVQEIPPVLDASLSPTVGGAFVRQAGLASLVLQQLLGDWWMDPTGVVQTVPRAATAITSDFVAMDVAGASGRYIIATESPGDWVPGSTFVGPTVSGTVNLVRHMLTADTIRTEVMAA